MSQQSEIPDSSQQVHTMDPPATDPHPLADTQTAQPSVGSGLGNLMGGVARGTESGFSAVGSTVDSVASGIGQGASGIGQGVGQAIGGVGSAVGGIMGGIGKVIGGLTGQKDENKKRV